MSASVSAAPSRVPWQTPLVWALLLLTLYALHDVFLVAFLTFLLSYAIRAIVVTLARRLGREGTGVERWLTLGTFAAIVALIWLLVGLVGPQLAMQSRLLLTDAERLQPEQVLNHFLGRTVGAWLFHDAYGGPDDPRYQAGLEQFVAQGRTGEGAYADFGRLESRVQGGLEIAYAAAERQRLRDQVLGGGGDSRRFDQWFLTVKAPALVAEQHDAYLARWQAQAATTQDQAEAGTRANQASQALDRHLAELALKDLQGQPAQQAKLVKEWEDGVAAQEWQKLKASPGYAEAFRSWFSGARKDLGDLPYDFDTYLALSAAYPEGMAAFNQVYRTRVTQAGDNTPLVQSDFRRAMETDLARTWWASNPLAASLREHLRQDATDVADAVADRLAGGMRAMIAIPVQVGTALLLTILITFDMARLKQGALRLRQTRVAALYRRVVPKLTAVARLVGRSFAAQGLIAVFNTLLTFGLFQLIGLNNELLLCSVVFIASFIPVLGVILAAIPIILQALLQPDGSLGLALYALLGIGVIHTIEATLLSPKIVGKILHLHPVLVMAVLVVGEHLFGIWGLLLGVPLTVYIIHVVVLAEAIPGVYEPAGPEGCGD